MYDLEGFRAAIGPIAVEDNPALVRQKSRDFYWYSPVLKRQLENVTADLVVTPKSEDEVITVLREAFARDIPVTPRGSGTGNYGQAMPLSGGIVLNLARMDKVKSISEGRVVAEPGAIIAQIDKQTREHSRQELRFHPSTANTASIAGFVAGGSGGVGSINWGGLRDLGNILRLRVATMEAEPKVLELAGWDLHKVSHAYGTNGIITEVEMPLTSAYDWVDILVGFDSFERACAYSDAVGNQNGLLVKEIAPVAAPVPYDTFLRHQKFLTRDQSVVVLMVAPQSVDPLIAFTDRMKGDVRFRSDQVESMKGLPEAFELTWNHTTLRAMKVDPECTYLQVQYPWPDHLKAVAEMSRIFGDEVPGHLEFIRFDGRVLCSGLPLVRFTTEDRLDEIIRIHEDHGCLIFNPHRYTLEEGGMKQTDRVQLAFKQQTDPKGLLNPGKMIAWENPDFDFKAGQTYLFPGLEDVMEA